MGCSCGLLGGFLSCAGVESLPLGVCFVRVLGVYMFLIIKVSLIEVLCEGGLRKKY